MLHLTAPQAARLCPVPGTIPLLITIPLLLGVLTLGCAHSGASTVTTLEAVPEAPPTEPFVSACEGQSPPSALASAETTPDPLSCDEGMLAAADNAPPTTASGCRALPAAERAPCVAHVRALRAAAASLRRARAAQSSDDWPTALDEFEDALGTLQSAGVVDAGVLGELAWARFLAHGWCAEVQEFEDLRDETDENGEPSPVATLCLGRTSLEQAAAALDTALTLDMSRERRAMLLYNLGRVAAAQGQVAIAAQHSRTSLCLRPNDTVREHYAQQLWQAGDSVGPDDTDEAQALHRQSLVVHADADRASALAEIEDARREPFALLPGPDADATVYPNMRELCAALLAPLLSQPLEPDEEFTGCDVDDWETVEREGEPSFSAGVLRLTSPEVYDGVTGAWYLVARVPAGVMVLLELGPEHGDSRDDNAYVSHVSLQVLPTADRVGLSVYWQVGTAYANGCDWATEASDRMAFCGWDGRRPRCFAQAALGPVLFDSDSMLGTVQEASGGCEGFVWEPRARSVAEYRPRYTVEVRERELIVGRLWGPTSPSYIGDAMPGLTCLPLLTSLCALPTRPATGCP